MFEHLDDPAPFVVDQRLRSAALGRGRRLRRLRRIVAGATALSVSLVGVGVAGWTYVDRREAAIDRVDIVDQPSTDGATNILLIGTDVLHYDPAVGGASSDTIVVVRLRDDGGLSVLAIPRDLVMSPGVRRFGEVFATDGPQAVVDTVTTVTGIPIDHVAIIDLTGFVQLVDEVGGLPVAVDQRLRDPNSGLLLEPADCVTLDGEQAIALVRARHVDGDPTADLGRIHRQGVVLSIALGELAEIDDPLEIDRLSRIVADHVAVDSDLDVLRTGRRLAEAASQGVDTYVVPVVDAGDDGEVLALGPDAPLVFAEFGAPAVDGEAAAPIGPADVPESVAPIRACE